ncbi:MAG TPA: AHH domain-containing protein, partial [Polyangium sp.]|nr:AHH domain-containing protein [Polyangium sp.]
GPLQRLRQPGQSLHHIVAHGDGRAAEARKILAKFKIDVDEAWNGVFLPATKNSPNPTGSVVHSIVHTNKYYDKVEKALMNAKSRKEVIQELLKIRDALENGTF